MINNNLNPQKNQISNEEKFSVEFLSKKSPSYLKILGYLLKCKYQRGFAHLFQSQRNIAGACKITREWTNKTLKVISNDGLIKSKYYHLDVCDYFLAPEFDNPEIRRKLVSIFPFLRCLPLFFLLSSTAYSHLNNIAYYDLKLYNNARAGIWGCKWPKGFKVERNIHPKLKDVAGLNVPAQCFLSTFPYEAIDFAIKEAIKHQNSIQDVFKYVIKLCGIYCNREKIMVDLSYGRLLALQLGCLEQEAVINLAQLKQHFGIRRTAISSQNNIKKTYSQQRNDAKIISQEHQSDRKQPSCIRCREVHEDMHLDTVVVQLSPTELADKWLLFDKQKERREKAQALLRAWGIDKAAEQLEAFDPFKKITPCEFYKEPGKYKKYIFAEVIEEKKEEHKSTITNDSLSHHVSQWVGKLSSSATKEIVLKEDISNTETTMKFFPFVESL